MARQLAIVWGAHSVVTQKPRGTTEMVSRAVAVARRDGFAKAGDRIVITAGVPLGVPGKTNVLRVADITDPED